MALFNCERKNYLNFLKNEIIFKVFTYKLYMYIDLTVCKQIK